MQYVKYDLDAYRQAMRAFVGDGPDAKVFWDALDFAYEAHGDQWRRSGDPYQLSPGQLLRETMVTSGTMTNRVDRLATRGLVHRTSRPDDRRGVLVHLTPAGRQAVDAAISDLLQAEQQILAALPHAQRDQLAEALRQLIAPYDVGR